MHMAKQVTLSKLANFKRKKVSELMLLDFKTYHKATVIKTVCYCQRINIQINGIEMTAKRANLC